MSAIFHANLLNMPNTTLLSKPNKKRWHMALATIYCTRVLFSHFRETLAKNKRKLSPPVQSSNIVIDVVQSPPCFSDIDQSLSPPVQSSNIVIDVVQSPPCFSDIDQSSLTQLVKEKKVDNLVQLGMVEGLAKILKTEVENGIHGDVEDIQRRHEAFGTNTYHKPPTKGFFHFQWEALKDPTILILLVWAALSLAIGIKEHGPKEGWYDGGSIIVAVFLVITASAICNCKQNRQFNKSSQISNNIQVEVVRSGRRQQISIFEIVVGDIVCLNTGDQIPADGLFLDGHSLQVGELSMTGESELAEINRSQNPFLYSGTKVAEGYGRMLVTFQ